MILVGARKMCLQPASSKHAALISSADSFLGLKSLAIPHRVLLPEPGSNSAGKIEYYLRARLSK